MVSKAEMEEKNMNSTALGAGAEKAQEIIFISEAHEKFYYEKLKEVMLSRLVDTFFSRTSRTMLLYAENHSISAA